MKYDSDIHHRRSIRLRGYDYSRAGAYFVTICTQHRDQLFGEVRDTKMEWNDAGAMVVQWWEELNRKFPNVDTDAFIVMPNHCHGILLLDAAEPVVGADLRVCP